MEASVRQDGAAQIAYILSPDFWGRGFATEACRRVIRLLFDDYGVSGIMAEVDTRNVASVRLLERLGFERIARRLGADFFKGSGSDEYTYLLVST